MSTPNNVLDSDLAHVGEEWSLVWVYKFGEPHAEMEGTDCDDDYFWVKLSKLSF